MFSGNFGVSTDESSQWRFSKEKTGGVTAGPRKKVGGPI